MSAQDEEDDRIDQLIADADWCKECDCPIGCGPCAGCRAVAAMQIFDPPWGYGDYDQESEYEP